MENCITNPHISSTQIQQLSCYCNILFILFLEGFKKESHLTYSMVTLINNTVFIFLKIVKGAHFKSYHRKKK